MARCGCGGGTGYNLPSGVCECMLPGAEEEPMELDCEPHPDKDWPVDGSKCDACGDGVGFVSRPGVPWLWVPTWALEDERLLCWDCAAIFPDCYEPDFDPPDPWDDY